jgi:hypothetical protein
VARRSSRRRGRRSKKRGERPKAINLLLPKARELEAEVARLEKDLQSSTVLGMVTPTSVVCDPASGREVVAFDLATGEGSLPLLPMSCAAVAESETSLHARRVDLAPQIPARLVEVLSVPEPGTAVLQTAALVMLLAMGRRRRLKRPAPWFPTQP